jgi:hypothetical protein
MGLIRDTPGADKETTMDVTNVLIIHRKKFELLLERSSSVSAGMVKEVSRRLAKI